MHAEPPGAPPPPPPTESPVNLSSSEPNRASPFFRELADHLPIPAILLDGQGKFLRQNTAHRAALGYTDETLAERGPATYMGDDQFEAVRNDLTSTGSHRGSVVCGTATGRSISLDISAFAAIGTENDGPVWVLLLRHASFRPHVEHELDQSVSLLQATLDSTADGLLVVDGHGRIMNFNKRLSKIWDTPPREALESYDTEPMEFILERLVDPEDLRATLRTLAENPKRKASGRLELKDGRTIEHYSRPQKVGAEIVGRVWSFRDVTEQIRVQEALREGEERYRKLFHNSRQAIYVTDPTGVFIDVNEAALELVGCTRDELFGMHPRDFWTDQDERAHFQEALEKTGTVRNFEGRLKRFDGTEMDCLLTTSAQYDSHGELVGYQGILDDISERKRAQVALRSSEEYFRSLIENALDTITILDREGVIRYQSPSVQRVLGYEPGELVGKPVFDYIHPDDRAGAVNALAGIMATPGESSEVELRFLHMDGSWRLMEAVGRNLLEDPVVRGVVINARDATVRREAEERLLHDAFHDKLTGLPNRALLLDRLNQMLARAKRTGKASFSVLFLDLDRFKVINDSLGHMIGDQLLISVARRLDACLRPGDTVARLGGDEFTMVLDGTHDEEEATRIANRVHEAMREPIILEGHEVFTAVSIGIAPGSLTYESAEEILRDADLAMYRAKSLGKDRHIVFDDSMRADAMAVLHLETELRNALKDREFRLFYQPIVVLETNVVTGFEALLRWEHPERGLLFPKDFISVAEETQIIIPLGWWVLEETIRQVAEWDREFKAHDDLTVHVNLSGLQLTQSGLIPGLRDLLGKYNVPGHRLNLELTEGVIMEEAEAGIRTLNRLKELGVHLSIDDFGTGYSSLTYLHRFPTQYVKLDRSFVANMDPDESSGIVRTIIDLAHDLGMGVIAEGIEALGQAQKLTEMKCEAGQGFYFGQAVPADEARALIGETLPRRTEMTS